MSVNLGHPAGHAHFFQVSIIVSEGREDIGIMDACLVDHCEEAFKRLQVDCACWLRNKGVANGTSKNVGLAKILAGSRNLESIFDKSRSLVLHGLF